MKHIFPRLDIMIAYACNISCAGCISLSDHNRVGIEPLNQLETDIDNWANVIEPQVITIFGGEPCIHPSLIEICQHVRKSWPNSLIRLITNGYLLGNFDPAVWFTLGNFEIQVSVHRKDHESLINHQVKQILIQQDHWQTIKHHSNGHKQIEWKHNDFSIYKSIFKDFIVPYKKINKEILAWNSNPADAHKICGAPNTPILYKGLLYKCPPVANTIDLTNNNWFGYSPYSIDSNLEEFIAGINKPETVCGQCPDLQQAVIINHFDTKNVLVKQKNLSKRMWP